MAQVIEFCHDLHINNKGRITSKGNKPALDDRNDDLKMDQVSVN